MAVGLLPAYGRVIYKGVKVNRRTKAALEWVRKRTGINFSLAQGSYNVGVAASAGTHDGGGVVDVRVTDLTAGEIDIVLRALKDAGFAAWYRPAVSGLWGPHIHAVLRGDKEMAPGAAAQVVSYDAKRSGLKGNAWDATYRPSPRVQFSYRLGKPVVL